MLKRVVARHASVQTSRNRYLLVPRCLGEELLSYYDVEQSGASCAIN